MRSKAELRNYQQRFATHLYEHDNALCVARPGYGKTVAALTAIRELLDVGVIRHALVLAPKRVARSVWPDEIVQWAHTKGLCHAVLTGSPAQRRKTLLEAHTRDITIVGLDVAQWLVEELDELDDAHCLFDLLVIDEVSRFRDPKGKRANAIAKRSKRWEMIWGMSGTLRPNGPLDLFMPARIVTRDQLWGRSYYKWRGERFYPTDYEQRNWVPLPPDAEDRINAELAPLVVTISDEDKISVPALSIVIDKVELPPLARQQYDEMEKKLFMQHAEGHVVASSAAIATGKLAQMSNGFIYDNPEAHFLHDAKREWLQDIIENAAGPTLLIYEYLEDLRTLRELLGDDLPVLGAGVSDRQSAANILAWNAGRLPFMALHPASGGHGLNLQHGGADMAWISPTWSSELWEQTIARLHRSGQSQPVVVRVCVASRTVDDLKLSRVGGKMAAQEAFEAYLRERGHASPRKRPRHGADSKAPSLQP